MVTNWLRNGDRSEIEFLCALVERILIAQGYEADEIRILEHALKLEGLPGHMRPLTQRPGMYFPGLRAAPFHDPAQFAWASRLREASEDIRAEARALATDGAFTPGRFADFADRGAWTELRLLENGVPVAEHLRRCPHTARSLRAVPRVSQAGLVHFSLLHPHTHLRAHCGPHNARLTCHLALEVPSNCRIRVGDEERSWAEGDVLIFDDSFEHEVWNDSDRERIVLIIDIWHPDLTDGQIAAIRLFGSPIVASAVAVATEWLQSGSVPRRLGKVDGGGDG